MEGLSLLGRILAVFVLLAVTLWLLRRTDSRGRTAAPLQVLSSARVGRGASVTVVRIGGEEVVLGVTEHAVTLLGPAAAARVAPDEAAPPDPPSAAPPADEEGGAAGTAGSADPAPPGADFRTTLAAELKRAGATPGSPPTTAQFVRGAYRAVRARSTTPPTELPPSAVQAALTSVTGARLAPPTAVDVDRASAGTAPSPRSVALRRAVTRSPAWRERSGAAALLAAEDVPAAATP